MRKGVLHWAAVGFVVLVISTVPAQAAESDGAKLYTKNCALCHAPDGSGSTSSGKALGAKDLGSSEAHKKSDAELTNVITNGKGKMPAFGKKISADEIKMLVAYIRALHKK